MGAAQQKTHQCNSHGGCSGFQVPIQVMGMIKGYFFFGGGGGGGIVIFGSGLFWVA